MLKFYIIVFIFLLLITTPFISPVFASSDKEKELDNINIRLEEENRELDAAIEKEKEFEKKLRANQDLYYSIQQEVLQSQKELEKSEKKLKILKKELQKKQKLFIEHQKELEVRLSRIYENSEPAFITMFITSKNMSDFLKMFYYVQLIVDNDFKLLKTLKEENNEILKKKSMAEKSYNEILNIKEKLNIKEDDMAQIIDEQRELLAGIRNERDGILANVKELEASSSSIENEIANEKKRMEEEILQKKKQLNVSYKNNISAFSNNKEVQYSLIMEATAYEPSAISCGASADGYTALGIPAGYGVVAVDPSVIPLGTNLYIEGYGYAIAADVGKAIKGNIIDLCFNTYEEAINFGRQTVKVYILN